MDIDIAAISLDVENFRHLKVDNERDAIRLLLRDEPVHKVAELAQDIVAMRGLDPSSRFILTAEAGDPSRYIALEGNRRITPLKTLMTPDLADGTPSHGIFKRLHTEFAKLNISTVDCVVMSKQEAAAWIKRKHYKGIGGKGVVQWNAVATARSDAAEGRYTRWMSALAFIEEHGTDAEDIRDSIARKTTTVERVFTSADITSVLGLKFERNGTVAPENGNDPAAVELLEAMFEAMSASEFKETLVSTKEQQRDFLKQFYPLSVKKEDDAGSEAVSGDPGGNGAGSTDASSASPTTGSEQGRDRQNGGGDGSQTTAKTQPSATQKPTARAKPVKDRKFLAEPGLRISNDNMNRFYAELRKLSVEKNPYVSAAVIRVFLEKATTLFLEHTKVPTLDTRPGATWHDFEIKLRQKVDAALKQIDPEKSDPKLAPARDVAEGKQDRLQSLDQLNRAIHDHHAMPAPSELLTSWSRYHPYFTALFEAIENYGK